MIRLTNSPGFTLVELLVVIAILGIVSGTVLVQTNPFEGDGRQELRQIRSFLRKQHAKTLRTGRTVAISFDAKANEILVLDQDNDEPKEVFTLKNWSLEGIGESLRVNFNPYQTGEEDVVLQHVSEREVHLRQNWTTGFRTVDTEESS